MVLIDPGRACRILSQIPVSVLKECRSLYLAGTFSPKFTPMTEWSFMCYRYLFLCSSHVRKTIGFPKRENIIMEPWFNLVCVLGDPLFSQSWSQSSGLSRIFPGTAFFIGCCYRRWLCNRYQNPGFFFILVICSQDRLDLEHVALNLTKAAGDEPSKQRHPSSQSMTEGISIIRLQSQPDNEDAAITPDCLTEDSLRRESKDDATSKTETIQIVFKKEQACNRENKPGIFENDSAVPTSERAGSTCSDLEFKMADNPTTGSAPDTVQTLQSCQAIKVANWINSVQKLQISKKCLFFN